MPQQINPITVLAKRLSGARKRMGLSQKQLGIVSGLDPFVASTRINRYERAIHYPDPVTVQCLANALGIPAAYLFASDDKLARLILAFHALPAKTQEHVVIELEDKAKG
ncbi:MAG: helix-turn-helix transcriptional regulator [Proteobacteria bacterium]|nr:helix-turn-helix transcriptional regulator [Pseudomonadota bacterium]